MTRMHIGFDDTDSLRKGCTTYIAALLVEGLHELGASFIDYPSLIRLNPNVPWKTRGNGALCLRIECREDLVKSVIEDVVDVVAQNSDLECANTDPGVVFLYERVPQKVKAFARQTIQGVVKMKEALKLIEMFKGEAVEFKSGRGIIGGLAAIGETLEGDHTFEILTYRKPENRGTLRRIIASSVDEMDEKTAPYTFNNIDRELSRVLVAPRGPDPVLYGIRGESPKAVMEGHEIIRTQEEIERWALFRTNQGTDAHLSRAVSIIEIRPYNPVIASGMVIREPRVIPGGHVIFSIKDETGQVDCAAYEPTGDLRKVVKQLIVGDVVEVYGGVRPASTRHPMTINLEKILVTELTPRFILNNPLCPKCGKRMKSMGTRKGFKCRKCGFRSSEMKKAITEVERALKTGLYVTPSRSQRHLTKPLCRYGFEKKHAHEFVKKKELIYSSPEKEITLN